jgi:molecular chaperone GrpE
MPYFADGRVHPEPFHRIEGGRPAMSQDAPEQSREDTGEAPSGDGQAPNELEALREEAAEYRERYLRAAAETENVRKRAERDVENARRYGLERLAQALLPVRDSLEAGLATADKADVEALLEGKRATLRLLDAALKQVGITELDPLGEPFDPEKHEAMTMQTSATAEPNTVLTVIQKGYAIHDRLLRPARVIVSRAAEPEAAD